jgi:hypothetical protein
MTARRTLVLTHGNVHQANPTARAQRGKGGPTGSGACAGAGRAADGGRKANPGREAH